MGLVLLHGRAGKHLCQCASATGRDDAQPKGATGRDGAQPTVSSVCAARTDNQSIKQTVHSQPFHQYVRPEQTTSQSNRKQGIAQQPPSHHAALGQGATMLHAAEALPILQQAQLEP
jgi:hypothetical protein